MSMTLEEIIHEYEAAVAAHAAAAAAGIKGAEKSYELFKAGLDALRPVNREQVEKVWFREPYTRLETWDREDGATVYSARNTCMACAHETPIGNFCHNCGAALTDEAVEMALERLEEMRNG